MSKRWIVLTLILLLSLALAQAADDEEDDYDKIYDEWLEYHDFFELDGDSYEITTLQVSSGGTLVSKTLLKRGGSMHFITAPVERVNNSYNIAETICEDDELIRYCIAGLSIDPDEGARADETGTYHFGVNLEIWEKEPDAAVLEVERIMAEEFRVGDRKKIHMNIKNTGTKKATNIDITEIVGGELEILDFKGMSRAGQKLFATATNLYPDNTIGFDYWVEAKGYHNKSWLEANITYEGPGFTIESDGEEVSIPWPYKMSFAYDKDEVKLNKESELILTIENLEDEQAELDMTIALSKEAITSGANPLNKVTNAKYVLGDTISAGEEKIYAIDVTSDKISTLDARADVTFTIKGHNLEWTEDDSLEVIADEVNPVLLPSKTRMRSGEELTVAFYLNNEDDVLPFFDLKGRVYSSFFNHPFSVESISPGASENPLFKTYIPPSTDNYTVETITAQGTYKTQAGETRSFLIEKEVIIVPDNQSLFLFQEVSDKSVELGDEIAVTITVENFADSGFSLMTTEESYTAGIEKIFGTISAETTLFGGEEAELYTYKLRVPYDWDKKNFTIDSSLYVRGELVQVFSTLITVENPIDPAVVVIDNGEDEEENQTIVEDDEEPKDQELNQTIVEDEEEVEDEEQEDRYGEEKTNFFSSLFKGIAGFFANLF